LWLVGSGLLATRLARPHSPAVGAACCLIGNALLCATLFGASALTSGGFSAGIEVFFPIMVCIGLAVGALAGSIQLGLLYAMRLVSTGGSERCTLRRLVVVGTWTTLLSGGALALRHGSPDRMYFAVAAAVAALVTVLAVIKILHLSAWIRRVEAGLETGWRVASVSDVRVRIDVPVGNDESEATTSPRVAFATRTIGDSFRASVVADDVRHIRNV
jgi:hypothetical protein